MDVSTVKSANLNSIEHTEQTHSIIFKWHHMDIVGSSTVAYIEGQK